MHTRRYLFLILGIAISTVGCTMSKPFDGPTVDKFNGRVVSDGKPVTFGADEKVQLKLFHEKGESFGIPLQSDGSFKIGWMPIGKYTATLIRDRADSGKKGGQVNHNVPGGLTIAEGQTEYVVELGKGWDS